MTDETLSVLRTRYNKNEHTEDWLLERQSLVSDWLANGHFMGESLPFNDWWLYRKDHQPGDARCLHSTSVGAALCRLMRQREMLVQCGSDGFARVVFYAVNTQDQE